MPEINFFWDPLSDNILQDRDETGAVTAEYTAEPGLYGNVISQNRGGVESQFHYDAQGSTLAATDDNQNVTDTFAYTAFGEVTERTGTTVVPYQYIGRKGYYTDSLTGHILARRRPYEPARARWLTVDPLGARDSTYRYAENGPISVIDPSGLSGVTGWGKTLTCAAIDEKAKPCCADRCKDYCWFTLYVALGTRWSQIAIDRGFSGACTGDLDRAPRSFVEWTFKERDGDQNRCKVTGASFDPDSGEFTGEEVDGPLYCLACVNALSNRDVRFETRRPGCAAWELVSVEFNINQQVRCGCSVVPVQRRNYVRAEINTGQNKITAAEKFSQKWNLDLDELCHQLDITLFAADHFDKAPPP